LRSALATKEESWWFVEQYDLGWHAAVDGRPAPLLRANLIMRALSVEAGPHRIVLEYRTPGLVAGATISALCLCLLALLGLNRCQADGNHRAEHSQPPAAAEVSDSARPLECGLI